jgi:enoyl-CoA hydratase/carnithine racemase
LPARRRRYGGPRIEEEAAVSSDSVLVKSEKGFTTITMNRPERRNALSLGLLRDLTAAFRAAGDSDARGVILAANGPVFSSGHDFRDLAGADLASIRELLDACTELMLTMQAIPQPVVARVHGLATAAGCQLVATADLAVASEDAGFATPGGKGGWFCHTPLVPVARNVSRKRALELGLTGSTIDARTAFDWGLVNRVVPAEELDQATWELLSRATRGSSASKALGKQTFYEQIDLDQRSAYEHALEVMARSSQAPDAQEAFAAFLEKRRPRFEDGGTDD